MARASRGKNGRSGAAKLANAVAPSRNVVPDAQKIVAAAVGLRGKSGGTAGQRMARAGGEVAEPARADQLAAFDGDLATAVDWESAAFRRARAAFATAAVPERQEARPGDGLDRAVPAVQPLQGYIDEANHGHIKGWVWDALQPESRIALELVDGDARLAKVVANQYRSDLKHAGIGDGRHAFIVPLEGGLLSAARNVLHLRCAQTGREVPGSPVVIERIMPVLSDPGTWGGVLEISQGFARGWVTTRTSKLNEPAVIQILDQYGKVMADFLRFGDFAA